MKEITDDKYGGFYVCGECLQIVKNGEICDHKIRKYKNEMPMIKTTKQCIKEATADLVKWLDEPCKDESHFPPKGRDHYIRYVKGQYAHRRECPTCWQGLKERVGL